jgi:hypothetical protein
MRSVVPIAASALLWIALFGCDDSTSPSTEIAGTWRIVGYVDHGVAGATTGTAVFRNDGTFSVLGTVTYPGETADSIDVSGTYSVFGSTLTLQTNDGEGEWSMAFSGKRVVLSLAGSDPSTSMTLERRSPWAP